MCTTEILLQLSSGSQDVQILNHDSLSLYWTRCVLLWTDALQVTVQRRFDRRSSTVTILFPRLFLGSSATQSSFSVSSLAGQAAQQAQICTQIVNVHRVSQIECTHFFFPFPIYSCPCHSFYDYSFNPMGSVVSSTADPGGDRAANAFW